jgi:hypothetical protein
VATAEIAMGFQMALAVLQRGLRGAMLAYLYWNQLRMRLAAPDARPYHQQVRRLVLGALLRGAGWYLCS